MNDAPLAADLLDTFTSGFADIAADFADEVGGPPALGEFLEVLSWSVPTNSDAVDGTFTEPLKLVATLTGGNRYRFEGISRVPELNDHVFEDARSHNASLAARLGSASGTSIAPQQYTAAILQIIRTGRIAFSDVDGTEGRTLAAVILGKRAATLVPGDILAIPVEPSGTRFAVVITRNRFGTAIGLFEGGSANSRPTASILRARRKFPVYTEESLVKNGAWKVVGHDDNLLNLFPADPEIYHKPGVRTGADGAAETAGGPLRMIDAQEAREVGLHDGSYRQTYPAAFLQKVLSAENR